MKITKIMTRDPEWIYPETTLEDAAGKMRDLDTGFLPVGNGERLLGILTDRDITVRGVAEGLDTTYTTVEDVMTPSVIYCFDDEDIRKAADLMSENQVRRLVVLNRDMKLTGVISLSDICMKCEDPELAGDVLENISHSPIVSI